MKEDTNYALNTPKLTELDKLGRRPEVPAIKFKIREIESNTVGKSVSGWETPKARTRTTVQRSHNGFFNEIEVDVTSLVQSEENVRKELEKGVRQSLLDSPAERRRRLAKAPKIPRQFEVRSIAFDRSRDVIAAVLVRAKGRCESCKEPAPFARKSDDSPYLEVHHKVRLADGGEDTIKNAHALCPNCHRREHYG